MGQLIFRPDTRRFCESDEEGPVRYAVSSMRGYRPTMEDAHTALFSLPGHPLYSFWAVFDGHLGPETAEFAGQNLWKNLMDSEELAKNNVEAALSNAFVKTDMDYYLDVTRSFRWRKESQSTLPDKPTEAINSSPVAIKDNLGTLRDANSSSDGSPAIQSDNDCVDPSSQSAKDNADAAYQNCVDWDEVGTTAVAAFVSPKKIFCANSGDSRCVLGQWDGSRWVSKAMSYDHKPAHITETERIVAAGEEVECERVNGRLAVSRGLGDFTFKCNFGADGYEERLPIEKQAVTSVPDIVVHDRDPADRFLIIACDGIWDVMSNQFAVTTVGNALAQHNGDVGQACNHLLYVCLNRGSGDNMTAIVVVLDSNIMGEGKWPAQPIRRRPGSEEETLSMGSSSSEAGDEEFVFTTPELVPGTTVGAGQGPISAAPSTKERPAPGPPKASQLSRWKSAPPSSSSLVESRPQ